MNKLTVKLDNCYGIKRLHTQFDFSKQNVYAIYAPNGVMKSSLAQTFRDVSDGVASKDRIFPSRATTRTIADEHGVLLPKESVVVVAPYDEVFGHTEKTSTLLVDTTLRQEYEQLHTDIDESKTTFLKALREQSGSKKNLEREISSAFTKSDDQFYRALIRIETEVLTQTDTALADIRYDTLFDEKVLAFLATKDFRTAIESYITKYNELLAKSAYFKKGTFNYYNAATIAKNLADNGFFAANHTVRLNASETVEISSQKDLEELIAKEKEAIFKDKDLRKKFADIEKLITKNVNVREFEAYLLEHETILPKLANMDDFKEELWKSYIVARLDLYKDLLSKYRAVEKRKRQIEDEAQKQRTQWESVIDIFNARFFVPFTLIAKNKAAVILGGEPLLTLGFTFNDGIESASVEKTTLIQTLSTGEKKALYILNIIFEVEARRKAKQETVFVIDDIADSFDYKNKYAIVQYLKDIADEPIFKQIILTHNFDFFRTLNSRFVTYPCCLMSTKTSSEVTLKQAAGIQNIFVKDWKLNFFKDPKKKIASIPFIRNIIEYTKGDGDRDYVTLTSLLHLRRDSLTITVDQLDDIFRRQFGSKGKSANPKRTVIEIIHNEAKSCLTAGAGINFENKIVLSIAIRLLAEAYMVAKINDPIFVDGILANQTAQLLAQFKAMFSDQAAVIDVMMRVVLMTPENIHVNSFMYEPILDMSDEHLRKLYGDVAALH